MSDRLQQIREAVARDGANLEDAYADRAWLLAELDSSRFYAGRLEKHLSHTLNAFADALGYEGSERPEGVGVALGAHWFASYEECLLEAARIMEAQVVAGENSAGGDPDIRGIKQPVDATEVSGGDRDSLDEERFRPAWEAVNALIRTGELPPYKHEERNGLVLAANAIAALMGWPKAKYAEELPEPPSTASAEHRVEELRERVKRGEISDSAAALALASIHYDVTKKGIEP